MNASFDQIRDQTADALGIPQTRFLALDFYCQKLKMKRTIQHLLDLKEEIDQWPTDKKSDNPELAYGYSRKQLDEVKRSMNAVEDANRQYTDEEAAQLIYRASHAINRAKEAVESISGAMTVLNGSVKDATKALSQLRTRRERRKALRHNGNHRRAH